VMNVKCILARTGTVIPNHISNIESDWIKSNTVCPRQTMRN